MLWGFGTVALSGGPLSLSGKMVVSRTLVLQQTSTLSGSRVAVQAATVQIDAGSKIDVGGKGYLGGAPAGQRQRLRTDFGQYDLRRSYRYSGGSYGGYGGRTGPDQVNAPYGDPTDPNEYGSGGGGTSRQAGRGAMAVALCALPPRN